MTSPSRPRVVLVGPPGSGKTTVGRVVARRLGTTFVDVDAVIVDRVGKSIADVFTQDGEDAFRAIERSVVAEQLGSTGGVLALGGGSVLDPGTRALLREHRVVSLLVGLSDGVRRTGMSSARPLLAGVNPRATFKALLDARAPIYREVATLEVDTTRRSANQVARAVLEALGEVLPGAVADPVDPHDPLDRPTRDDAPLLPTPTVRDGGPAS